MTYEELQEALIEEQEENRHLKMAVGVHKRRAALLRRLNAKQAEILAILKKHMSVNEQMQILFPRMRELRGGESSMGGIEDRSRSFFFAMQPFQF